jgi:hypothetical protein
MKTLTVKLPDGTTESRKSDRPYTHAIIVVVTEERRRLVLDKIEKTIAEHEATIAANAPLVELPEQASAYAAAQALLAFLDEEVTEERNSWGNDGKTYQHTCMRWLSQGYRNQVASEDERRIALLHKTEVRGDTAMSHRRAAGDALLATARGKVEKATAELVHQREFYDRRSGQLTVGRASVHGWSQSAKNAAKAEQAAREENPGAHVYTTTEVSVHVPKARAAKGESA